MQNNLLIIKLKNRKRLQRAKSGSEVIELLVDRNNIDAFL